MLAPGPIEEYVLQDMFEWLEQRGNLFKYIGKSRDEYYLGYLLSGKLLHT